MGVETYILLCKIADNLENIAVFLKEIAKKLPDCSQQPEKSKEYLHDSESIRAAILAAALKAIHNKAEEDE